MASARPIAVTHRPQFITFPPKVSLPLPVSGRQCPTAIATLESHESVPTSIQSEEGILVGKVTPELFPIAGEVAVDEALALVDLHEGLGLGVG